MKKKGFTLVELLAVIAILAILVIIALPNVMSMFNQAKENSFTTEIKEIYKQAQQQWISDSMLTTDDMTYYRSNGFSSGTNNKKIDLTGRTELDYYIVINKAGKVEEYYATDGSYQYIYDSSIGSDLQVEQIGKDNGGTVVQVSSITDNKYLCIGAKDPNDADNETIKVFTAATASNACYK